MLNVHDTGFTKSVETDILLHSHMNFGVLFHNSIVNTFSLYHFYPEIYARYFFNLIRKKVVRILVECYSDCNDFIVNLAVKIVDYLNLAMPVAFFNYISIKFRRSDYNALLRFCNNNEEKKKINECVLYIY